MPKVSIILPVYNVEKYISHCLDSIISQSYSDFEVIAVNDASPDRSIDIVKDYAKHDSRIKIIDKEHSGLGLTRNKGIKHAEGEYLLFVDSDDYLSLNALEVLVKKSQENDSDIIFFNYVTENNYNHTSTVCPLPYDSDTKDNKLISELYADIIGKLPESKFNSTSMLGSAWRRFIKKELLINNNIEFSSEQKILLEDSLVSLKLHNASENTLLIPDILYHYRYNPVSLTTCFRPKKFEMLKEYYNTVINLLNENQTFDLYKQRLQRWFIRFATHESIVNIFSPANKISIKQRYNELKSIINDSLVVKISSLGYFKNASIKDKLIAFIIKIKLHPVSYAFYRIYSLINLLR